MTPGVSNPGASQPGRRAARCVPHAPRVGQPGHPFVQGTDNAVHRAFVERTKFGQRGFGVLDLHLPEQGFFSLRRSDGPAPSRPGRDPERPSQERNPPGLRGRVRSSRAERTLCCGRSARPARRAVARRRASVESRSPCRPLHSGMASRTVRGPFRSFDTLRPFDKLKTQQAQGPSSGHRKLNGLSSGVSKRVRPCRVPPVRRFSPYRALIAAAPPPTTPSTARARPRSRPPRPPVAPAVPRGRRDRLPRCAGS